MNILLDALPKTVEIAGIPWKIHSDFRTSVQFELLMQKSGLTDEDRLLQALALYFPTLPDDLPAAVEQMLWFYRCGEAAEEDSGTGAGPVYSFEHDADLIYAAFLAQYRIDLNADTLHWWKFIAGRCGPGENFGRWSDIEKVTCPYCGATVNILYTPTAQCCGVWVRCKARHCRREFEVVLKGGKQVTVK